VDVDGVERIDFANNMASLIHGHAHPAIVAAVTAQLNLGTAFTMATEAELLYAEQLCGRSPNFDKVRFVNSGTEAVMTAMKAARAFTGRAKIAKVEGAYHGTYDYAEASQSPAPDTWGRPDNPNSVPLAMGTPEGVLADVVIIPFNDPDTAVAILDQHREGIAGVLLDLMPHRVGLIPASEVFVRALRDWTRDNDALLIVDEVITFREEVGGMQDRYTVLPDLTAMAKIIGGGFPVGAVAGRDEVMSVFAATEQGIRLPHSGTFSANPVTMTAGRVAMELYDQTAVEGLNKLGDLARSRISEAIELSGAPASVTGSGSLFRIHMRADPPVDYRSAYQDQEAVRRLNRFIDGVYDGGIMMLNTAAGALSTAIGVPEIDRLAEVVQNSLRNLK
jgi:glutamate-1-semialdehyde 2,1-aminomutase